MPGICKVGITNNVNKRLKDLNKTGLPTRFQIYAVFDLPNAEILEQMILQYFANKRINRKREFLKVHPERICDFIVDNKNIKKETEKEIKGKLAKLGIKKGDILKFKYGEDIYSKIVAEVINPNASKPIKYDGKILSLSESAKRILKTQFDKKWKSAQGTIYWAFKGRTIRELLDEMIN